MKRFALFLLLIPSALLASAKRPNILLICVDDLRPELGCYGADYMQTPNIDRLASQGRLFLRHYVQAPTCGASRYAMLTGQYGPSNNNAFEKRTRQLEKDPDSVSPSLPQWLREHGYTTVSIGKVSHYPGGLGGANWDDPAKPELPDAWDRSLMPSGPWQSPKGAMHGLANGEARGKTGTTDVYQSEAGPDTTYPDGLIKEEALKELGELSKADKPFFLAVGFIRPHLPFGSPETYMEPYRDIDLPPTPHPNKPAGKTTWHGSNEFMRYNLWGKDPREDAAFAEQVRRHYDACVTYADKQVGDVLDALKKDGLDKDTIIVLWGDHGWHLGEHAIWGKHALFEESLHAPLIIVTPGMKQPGASTKAVVETVDLYPTLCDLAGLPLPPELHGESLTPQLDNPDQTGGSAVSYQSEATTIRTDNYRLIAHKGGYYELYDHRTPEGETLNIAKDQPEAVEELNAQLQQRLSLRSE